jgi:D-serine deaminase-like pyridoxal phosphate-dependent protein
MHSLDQYRFEGTENILTPALVIYPDLVEKNIKAMLRQLDGNADRWRPHVKTAKLRFVMEMLLQHGIRHFKAATTLELLTLCKLGATDVLLAHPVVGAKQKRLAKLATEFPDTKISVIVENLESAQVWRELPIGVFVDVNPGMDRTGVSEARLFDVLSAVGSLPYFRGLHYYDGHLNIEDFAKRTRVAHAGYTGLMNVILTIQSQGIAVPEVITSGTPTFACALSYHGFAQASFVHRVSPGTLVYCDMTSLHELPASAGYAPSALVLSTVVSNPRPNRITCDAGHKSISADAGVPTCAVVGHPDFKPQVPSEEHLAIDVDSPALPRIGEQLFLLPRHICPTVNNFDHALMVRSGRVQGVEGVTARGHEAPTSEFEDLARW